MVSSIRLEPQRAAELLRGWFASRDAATVTFCERVDPEVDPSDGYCVAYEASFAPSDLHRAFVEVWVTDDGFVAFGFERRRRVGMRLRVERVGYDMFAAGIEPAAMSEQQVLSLLQLAADGRIGLRVTTLPLVGVVSVNAFVPAGTKARNGLAGSSFEWLGERAASASVLSHVLEYEPW